MYYLGIRSLERGGSGVGRGYQDEWDGARIKHNNHHLIGKSTIL